MLGMLGKVALASIPLVALCAASSYWLLAAWATQPFVHTLIALLATVVLGALVFLGCGAVLHIEELDELIAALRRRLGRAR
jgi:hypothetical protein